MIDSELLTIPSKRKEIKKDLIRFRNGMVADIYRKGNLPFPMVYGLLVPQLKEIAAKYPQSLVLAKDLWQTKESREERLLALYLLPEEIRLDEIYFFINSLLTKEEADMIAFLVLRKLPYAKELYNNLNESEPTELNPNIHNHLLTMFKRNLESLG